MRLPTTSLTVSAGLCIGKTANTPSATRTCCFVAAYCATQRAAMALLFSQVGVYVYVNMCVCVNSFHFNLSCCTSGPDTKLMQNSGRTKFKRTSIDRLMNTLVLWVRNTLTYKPQLNF